MKGMITVLVCASLLTSCTTSKESTLLGVGIGSAVGAGLGAAVGKPRGDAGRGAAIGAVVGGMLGGVAGYMEHRKPGNGGGQSQLHLKSSGEEIPTLTFPEIRRVWVSDRIEGNKFVKGHFIYLIDRRSQWKVQGKKNGK